MYVGRIVAVGLSRQGKVVGMYRVSSRSFPNRQATVRGKVVAIVPREGFEPESEQNPFVSYNCIRVAREYIVVGNGTHTDLIAGHLDSGMNGRDALVSSLFELDYEQDDLATPRIGGVIKLDSRCFYLGVVRRDALLVREVEVAPGQVRYIATYEQNYPSKAFRDDEFVAREA